MATFSKTSALSARRYVSEYGMSIPDLSNKLRVFQSHSSVIASEKQRYNRNFQSFLALKYLLVASFKEGVHSLQENIYLNQARAFQINQGNFEFFGRTPPFLL